MSIAKVQSAERCFLKFKSIGQKSFPIPVQEKFSDFRQNSIVTICKFIYANKVKYHEE